MRFSRTMKNTCLIGPFGRSGVLLGGCRTRFAGTSWRSARTVSFLRRAASGTAPIPTLPNVIRGMNCLGAPVWSRVSEWNGSGPFGLAPVNWPRIFAMTDRLPLPLSTG